MNARISSPAPAIDEGRRDTLRWAFGLSVGAALAPLAGCGGSAAATEDTLPEALVLESKNGLLDMTLAVRYANQQLDSADPQEVYPGSVEKINTSLRSYNGRYMAPTLYLTAGDTLRVDLRNELPPSPSGQSALSYLNHQNSTNLHFHGLHVDPKEIRPGVFGDYVVDTPEAGVLPGAGRQHEITIPANHTNGIYWYHPHLHGSSNVQVVSGMFGAILVRDPNDRFIDSPGIRERVMFIHKTNMTEDGKTESFYDSLNAANSASLINGAFQPTIVMRPGEVQQWHFINASSFFPFNPLLDGHTLWHYARDGNVFNRKFRPINLETSTQFDNQQWPGNALYPGNRHSVVVKASNVPGTYYLRSAAAPSSDATEIVARIVVEGLPMDTPLPSPAALPQYAEHVPITDEELAANGGKTRALILGFVDKDDEHLDLPIPAGEEWFVPVGDGLDGFANIVFAVGSFGGKLAPFQSSLAVTQTVALNAVEEWTIYNMNPYPHPFHIHVNDSYVVKVNGEDVTPYWADTLPLPPYGTSEQPTSITFRMRFTDFTGKYVWHCHALDHEDMGMMQLVEVRA